MQLYATKPDCIATPSPPRPTDYRKGLNPAENLWRVIEIDLIHDFGFECGPVQLASGFNHERAILLAAQMFHHAWQIGTAILGVAHDHVHATGLDRLPSSR